MQSDSTEIKLPQDDHLLKYLEPFSTASFTSKQKQYKKQT